MKLRTRILRDAQDLIQSPDRWRQGGMETRKVDGTTRRCMTGAICQAAGASEVEIGSNPIIDEAIQIVSFTIQNRPEAKDKLDAFMTAEDIEHCPPGDTDWLAAFNDHSSHSTVIGLLDEAIAASEPCEACREPLTPESIHFVTIADEPEQVLCDPCSLLHGHHPDEHPLPAYSFTKGVFTWHS